MMLALGGSRASAVVGGMLPSVGRWALQHGRSRALAFWAERKLWSEEAQTGEEWMRLGVWGVLGKDGA